MGSIYKITNLKNNKIYIGKTINSIEDRFNRHIKDSENPGTNYFHRAINKYGKNNFKIELVEECLNDNLNEREKFWINYYNSTNNLIGYNCTIGGDGGDTFSLHSEEEKAILRKNMSNVQQNKVNQAQKSEKLKKIWAEKYNNGYVSPTIGNIPWNKGLTAETDERIKKVADAQRGVPKGTGKASTEEKEKLRRHKISESMKGKRNGLGNSSTTGMVWINNGEQNHVVKKEEINKWIDNGWNYGMYKEFKVPYNAVCILDMTNNKEYYSISEASRQTGISAYYIKKSIEENKPYKGIRFYVKE